MIKVGLIGFGGIARGGHLRPYARLEEKGIAKLVAVCDVDPAQFEKKVEINIDDGETTLSTEIKRYTDWHDMLENESLDLVDICVPTFLHKELTVEVLKLGYNVLCEKPMSLNYNDCKEMCEAASAAGKKLMIGQCLRFAPAYVYLKNLVDEGTYGKVKSCVFQRLSKPPIWGWENWFMDYNKSGGCALDLHIHDIDMARYIWGNPKKVSCATADVYSKKDIVHSRLMYDDFSVMAIGDWTRMGLPFSRSYEVAFEDATVIYDAKGVNVYPRNGEAFAPEIDSTPPHQAEIEFLVKCIEEDKEVLGNIPEDSALSVKLVNTLAESSDKNGEFVDFITE